MIARAGFIVVTAGLIGCGGEAFTDDAAAPMDDTSMATGDDAGRPADDAFVMPMPDAGPVDAGPLRMDPTLPVAAGTCPAMDTSGMVSVSPMGIAARQAQIWVGPESATADGPVVFFWHGAGGSPSEAPFALGDALMAITAAGGVVIAPVHDPAGGAFNWFLAGGSREDDLLTADELVACAEQTIGIDERHIHSIGFSAGAIHTTQMSFRRASYVASVVVYSGGIITPRTPPTDAPDARFAAMILFGGEGDEVVVNFADASRRYHAYLEANPGYFGFLCDHGMGHTVPAAARASAWQFMQDHPFGMHPHAYESGLPAGFYAPCAL